MSLEDLLEIRYPAPRWATFRELSESAGGGGRIDMFAISTWPSDGSRTIAFEVKRSRRDFLREIEKPSKRAWVERQAGECFFVFSNDVRVDTRELPEGWGLLRETKKGGKLRLQLAAKQRASEITDSLARSIARRAAQAEVDAKTRSQEGHGEGQCVPLWQFESEQAEAAAQRIRAMELAYAVNGSQSSLWELANEAHRYGITEWTPTLVRELVDVASMQRLRGMSHDIVRAHKELDILLKRLAKDSRTP